MKPEQMTAGSTAATEGLLPETCASWWNEQHGICISKLQSLLPVSTPWSAWPCCPASSTAADGSHRQGLGT